MNEIKLHYSFIFLLCFFNYDNIQTTSSISRAIFSLEPLTKKHEDPTLLQTYIPYLQNAALPLSACFFYSINKNNIMQDITQHPYATALLIYCTIQYGIYTTKEHQQKIRLTQLKNSMQEVFYIIIIGHGLHNVMTQTTSISYQTSTIINVNFDKLDAFLQKAHDLWMSLFLEYKTDFNQKPIIIYHSDEIKLFDILQAASHDRDLMNLMANCYLENSFACNYQAIFQHLEKKLAFLNDQFIHIKIQTR